MGWYKSISGIFGALILVLAVVLAGGAGYVGYMYSKEKNTLDEQMMSLHDGMLEARNLAIAQNEIIRICGTRDMSACNGTFSNGWMAFIDTDGSGVPKSSVDIVASSSTGVGVETQVYGDDHSIVFLGGGGADRSLKVNLCHKSILGAVQSRRVLVSQAGQVSASSGSGSSCKM